MVSKQASRVAIVHVTRHKVISTVDSYYCRDSGIGTMVPEHLGSYGQRVFLRGKWAHDYPHINVCVATTRTGTHQRRCEAVDLCQSVANEGSVVPDKYGKL